MPCITLALVFFEELLPVVSHIHIVKIPSGHTGRLATGFKLTTISAPKKKMIVWITFLRTFCKFVSSIRKSKRSSQCVNSCFLACNVLCMSFKLAKIDNVGRKLMVCTIYLQCMCSTPSIHNGHSTACSSPRSSSSSSIFSSHANGNFNLVIRYPLRPHRQLMVSL